ncbi:hypothetical protein BDW72DRAFT_59308 [Aspergillus terricola var. indicus]
MVVNSRSNFDCDAFTAELEENSGYPEDGSSLTCGPVQSSGLSKMAKILIGVWLPFGVAILVSVAISIRKKRREASKKNQWIELVEMPPRTPPTPSLPSAREEPRPATAPSDIIPDEPPPPYTPKPSEV